jgi:arsenite methyltransferase
MLDSVKDYYGTTLQSSDDLKTDACCTVNPPPVYLKNVLNQIHDEVMARYYGCGLVAPEQLHGLNILDLGSGSGRDAYALAALVGEFGNIVGVDMTDEQLEVANRHLEFHREAFGYQRSNVTFHKGYLEKLDELGFADNSCADNKNL